MFLVTSLREFRDSVAPTRAIRRLLEVASVVIVSGLAMVLWPVERVTWENFDRIGIGMTRAEVRRVLVQRPDEQLRVRGHVLGPERFHRAMTKRPGRDSSDYWPEYHVEVWESPGLAIVVVFDGDDRVACRYTGTGHSRRDWLDALFPSLRGWLARLF
jgi:hypothetical protein